ncbi:MAG: ABC transporter substrate-binding protein [Inquilinaceae bacterium]
MTFSHSLLGVALAAGVVFGAAGVASAQDCPADLPVIEPGKLVMSINATIPPRQFINASGELQGMHPDLGNEIARRLCLEPEYRNVGFEVQIPGLANKRWDMINTGMYYTEERSRVMRMVPYVVNALAIVVEAGNPLGVTGYEDLAGEPVGTEIAGFADNLIREINEKQIAEGMESMQIQAFNTFAEAFAALGAGQVRAVFGPDATAVYFAQRGQFAVGANGLNPGLPSSFGFDPSAEALANAVRDVLADMKADGTYDRIMDEYGATKMDAWDQWSGDFEVFYAPQG